MTSFFRILGIAFIGYLVWCAMILMMAKSVVFAPQGRYVSPAEARLAMEEVKLKSSDGTDLILWYAPPAREGAPVLMFFGGNASLQASYAPWYRDIMAAGNGVLVAAYPGYPGSGGKPSEKSFTAAAVTQYDWLAKRVPAERIALYGSSLGTSVAAQLAARREVALLIFDAPTTSEMALVQMVGKGVPLSLFMRDKFLTMDAIQGLKAPLLWLHGTTDRVVPLHLGQEVYDAYPGPKSKLIVTGGRHGDIWQQGGRDATLAALAAMP